MPALQSSIDDIRIAAEAADRIKARDIVAFDVTEPLGITDIMMIAGASNERQVLAVAEEIERDLYVKCGGRQPRERFPLSYFPIDYFSLLLLNSLSFTLPL